MARRDDAPAVESENPLAKRRNQALLDKIMNRDSQPQPQPLARRGWRRVKEMIPTPRPHRRRRIDFKCSNFIDITTTKHNPNGHTPAWIGWPRIGPRLKNQSEPCRENLYIAPGSGGTGAYGTNVAISPVDFLQ